MMDKKENIPKDAIGSRSSINKVYLALGIVVGSVFLLVCFWKLSLSGGEPIRNIDGMLHSEDKNEYLWGTYRGNIYFGTRMAEPISILTGMMWFGINEEDGGIPNIRYECDMKDKLHWGWNKHDGKHFGHEVLMDYENNLELNVKFHKRSDNDWRVIIDGNAIEKAKAIKGALIYYFTYNGEHHDYNLAKGQNDGLLINGSTLASGNFTFSAIPSDSIEGTIIKSEDIADGQYWKIKDAIKRDLSGEGDEPKHGNEKLYYLPEIMNSDFNTQMIQIIYKDTFQLEIAYQGNLNSIDGKRSESGSNFDDLDHKFDSTFRRIFTDPNESFQSESLSTHMTRISLSNLLGGISYFYGTSLLMMGEGKIVETAAFDMMTDTPSRTTFPRGFLWDSGFHNLIISRWSPALSFRILQHWVKLINEDGWIAREQIPGEEARGRVPKDRLAQSIKYGNPPTLLISIFELILKCPECSRIDLLLEPLERNLKWYLRTQYGSMHPDLELDNSLGLFRWRGRSDHHTLTSGLDDYPRGFTPNKHELHVDLASWIALTARTLSRSKRMFGPSSTEHFIDSVYHQTISNIQRVHWNARERCFGDRTLDGDGNLVFVENKGYISIFPLLLGLVHPESPKIPLLFDLIQDERKLWSRFGIRSLSLTDPFYMKGDQYWTGPIWINMNYLLLGSLKLNYMHESSPYNQRASKIYHSLRGNLIENMSKQFQTTGFIWEQYDDIDGHGSRSHPFTGWSALISMIIVEDYPKALKYYDL